MSAELFSVSLGIGAAVLAIWIDVRWPSLAPESIVHRFLALGASCVLLQLAAVGFERAMGLSLVANLRSLLALGVLLPAMTFAFVTAVWLLRSLQSVSTTR